MPPVYSYGGMNRICPRAASLGGMTTGLTAAQVRERIERGQTNRAPAPQGRSITDILRANIFTVFNGILAAAAAVVLIVGQWQDAVFVIVLVVNTLIGTVAEIRAKRVLDSVAIVDAPVARVIRDGRRTEIPAEEVVLDDVLELGLGDQVPVDAEVIDTQGIRLDESILTGESEPQVKQAGDQVLSGSSVVAGSATVRACAVGADSYANTLAAHVRRYRKVHSELAAGIDYILTRLSWVILPLALLVMWAQMRASEGGDWRVAAVLAVAAVVGMIPQGLVLLTSMNFAVAGATLARRGAIVQELPAVEVLARVDTLCLDKTGTLTTGHMQVREIDDGGTALTPVEWAALHLLSADRANATAAAIDDYVSTQDVPANVTAGDVDPFDSAKKYGAVQVEGVHYALGAPDVLLAADKAEQARQIATTGSRVVAFASGLDKDSLQARALVVIGEEIRSDAKETFAYLAEQGIRLLVISGDHPATAGAVAAHVGIAGGEPRIGDARDLPKDPDALADALDEIDVLGRVTPEQKRDIVLAQQAGGHVVGMTGDGVNDAMALKEADLGIAMDNGAGATKAVARLVLLSGKFGVLPHVLAEGRRVMANMERVSVLFLTKTTYAIVLALVTSTVALRYPFLPRHLTVIGSLSIGIPAFILALAPNTRRYRAGFLRRVLRQAIPAGLVVAIAVIVAQALAVTGWVALDATESYTVTMLTALIIALALLATFCRPLFVRGGWPGWRAGLLAAMVGVAALIVAIPGLRSFAALALLPWRGIVLVAVLGSVGAALVWASTWWASGEQTCEKP